MVRRVGALDQRTMVMSRGRIIDVVPPNTEEVLMHAFPKSLLAAIVVALAVCQQREAHSTRYDQLANTPLPENHATKESAGKLMDELVYQRGVQSYLWSLPAVSMRAMQEASEKTFGKGYNVLPIWKQRLSAKTQVPTPNSDVIYARGSSL
jgi:hypothetical protein